MNDESWPPEEESFLKFCAVDAPFQSSFSECECLTGVVRGECRPVHAARDWIHETSRHAVVLSLAEIFLPLVSEAPQL